MEATYGRRKNHLGDYLAANPDFKCSPPKSPKFLRPFVPTRTCKVDHGKCVSTHTSERSAADARFNAKRFILTSIELGKLQAHSLPTQRKNPAAADKNPPGISKKSPLRSIRPAARQGERGPEERVGGAECASPRGNSTDACARTFRFLRRMTWPDNLIHALFANLHEAVA
jgi:hypothetical protein